MRKSASACSLMRNALITLSAGIEFSPINNCRRRAIVLVAWLVLVAGTTPSLQAQADNPPDGVMLMGGLVYTFRGTQTDVMTEETKLPFDVVVKTNGTFTVGEGKERKLEDGDVIRRDGSLLSGNGLIRPVYDHVAMKDGQPVIVRNDKAEPLTTWTTFPNNMRVAPDGTCVYPDGAISRLMDGQLFRVDGTPVPTKETITFQNGKVMVQRFGKLIPVTDLQIMGMPDGSRLNARGLLLRKDGSTLQLRDGQTLVMEGLRSRHR